MNPATLALALRLKAAFLAQPDDDDERCRCRELTGNSRHVPECDLADNDEYDKVQDEVHA
jgi:hypothetical protein